MESSNAQKVSFRQISGLVYQTETREQMRDIVSSVISLRKSDRDRLNREQINLSRSKKNVKK